MDLLDYLNNAQSSLFRFERLQEYNVGEETEEDMREWWNFIEQKVQGGVTMQRVRYVKFPLTEYTEKELETHQKSVAKGDDIRTLISTQELSEEFDIDSMHDFWLVDDVMVLLMNYDDTGKYLGFTIQENVVPYIEQKEWLLEHSTSLATNLNNI